MAVRRDETAGREHTDILPSLERPNRSCLACRGCGDEAALLAGLPSVGALASQVLRGLVPWCANAVSMRTRVRRLLVEASPRERSIYAMPVSVNI
jgi:hypothetical protein